MKNLCFLFLMAISTAAYSQSDMVRLYIQLKYEDDTPYANSLVYLKNMTDESIEESRTDSQGKLKYRLENKTTYELQLKKNVPFTTIKIPKNSRNLLTKTFTVSEKEYPTYPSDSIFQDVNPRTAPTADFGMAEIFIGDRHQKPIRDLEVRLLSKKTGKTYITRTTNTGRAFFRVPTNDTYSVGLEEFDDYKEIKIPNSPNVYFRTGFLFAPTNMEETVENDTVRQTLPDKLDATSARAWVHILVKNYADEPLDNEQVAINPRGDSLTYIGKTNDQGEIDFLLPVGKQYVLHFYYERNIDLLDFRIKGGLHKTNIQYTYRGTEEIQKFYKTSERDKYGFLKEFEEVPIEPLVFEEKDYIEKTEDGYNIDFKQDKGTINTPTVVDGKIYTSAGYYSRNLYVFDEKTGQFIWGVSLSEGGPSSIIHEDGVLLLITESCTLYAIDAKTGKLLWSKYLSPYMYSTPSVLNGKVITTYPKRLYLEKDFVMGCFDLKTGNIEWQKNISGEAIAAPVLVNDKIFTATNVGFLYQHDLATGNELQMDSIQAVTPPTVVGNDLFIGVLKNEKEQHLIKLAADNFQQKVVLSDLQTTFEKRPQSADVTMSFDGIRPLHRKGKNYLLAHDHLICSDVNGRIIWKSPLRGVDKAESPYNIMPILANNTVVATKGNFIQLFDATTGKSIKEYEIQGEALTQPTLSKGVIYAGSHEQRVITINTKNKTIDGWNMWGKNGTHNTVIED